MGVGYVVFLVISWGLMFMAVMMTLQLAPVTQGSGVAEAMGYLNGVVYPDYISVMSFIVKFCGTVLAVSAGICGGKEGPLVHMGTILGVLILYLPFNFLKYYRNDVDKRKFIATGLASGISAAFGAPIGGSLFAYELSKPNTFWSFSLTWRVFFSCSICTFFLNIFKNI